MQDGCDQTVSYPVNIGDFVVYVDEVAVRHNALVTQTWGDTNNLPGVNLLYVVGDESQTDPYGRQIVRQTSVVSYRNQPAHGRYYIPVTGDTADHDHRIITG